MGNANSGRRPQPTALKVLRGNPGQRKLKENEVRPPSGEPIRPSELSHGALVIWNELAPVCLAMGTLTSADVRPFAALCELQATLLSESAKKDQPDAGFSPKIERETATALRPYYALFGLEPVSRAKLSVPASDTPVSKWAGALG